MSDDILQPISDEHIPKLIDIYSKDLPHNLHIFNYLHRIIKCKALHPDENLLTLYAPYGNWKNGTIVGLNKFYITELILSSLEKDYAELITALKNTKIIKWNAELKLFAIRSDIYLAIVDIIKERQYRPCITRMCDVWWLSQQESLAFEISCPSEVYIDKLHPSHAEIIDFFWTRKFKGSVKHIATQIKINGGFGVFLTIDRTLVAWIINTVIGLGNLHCIDKYKRNGYATLISQVAMKELAKDDLDAVGTVFIKNWRSQGLFRKLGCKIIEKVVYVDNVEMNLICQSKY